MDLYQFTEMLRRQARLAIAGAIIIVGLVAALGLDYDGGIQFRAKPRAESTIQMAVVPAEYDSLASTLPNSGTVAGTAALYATILSAPETAVEISQGSGVELLDDLAVTNTGRDGFIEVKATAADKEGAKAAALYSFTWLEDRIAAPLTIVQPVEPLVEQPAQSVLNDEGEFVGTLRVEASPAFVETATGLWVGLTTEGTDITFSLADAGGQMLEYVAELKPDSDMVMSLEDVFGNRLDEIAVQIPPLPDPAMTYDLIVRLDRGMLSFPQASVETGVGDPELLERHVYVSWQQSLLSLGSEDSGASNTSGSVGLLLLTEDPVAETTGARRGPVLMLAGLVGGFFALLSIVVAVDTWSRAREENETMWAVSVDSKKGSGDGIAEDLVDEEPGDGIAEDQVDEEPGDGIAEGQVDEEPGAGIAEDLVDERVGETR